MNDGVTITSELPPGTISIPAQGEDYHVIMKRDWARLRKYIEGLQSARREFAAVAWAAVGIVVSAVFAGMAWAPALVAMPSETKSEFAWVWPAIIALGALGLVTAVMCFWGAHLMKDRADTSVELILTEMDSMIRA